MNRAQKIACSNLIIIATSLALSSIAIGLLATLRGMPNALGGLGFLGICGLIGMSPILFRKKQGEVSFDERDQLIHKRATLVAYSVFWVFFAAACMIPWWILETGARIWVVILPVMFATGFVIFNLIQSVTTIVQYGCRAKEKHYE